MIYLYLTFGRKRIVKGYPTEKPVNLAKILIKQSTNEGDVVIDPFCGAGFFVGCASEQLKRKFRGNDLNKEACDLAKNKILAIRNTL